MCVVIRGIKTSTLWGRQIQAFHLPSVHNKTTLTFGKMAPVRLLKLLFLENTCIKLCAQTSLEEAAVRMMLTRVIFKPFTSGVRILDLCGHEHTLGLVLLR